MKNIVVIADGNLDNRGDLVVSFFKRRGYYVKIVKGFSFFEDKLIKLRFLRGLICSLIYPFYFVYKCFNCDHIFISNQRFSSKFFAALFGKILLKEVSYDFYVSEYDVRINDRLSIPKESVKAYFLRKKEVFVIKNIEYVLFLSEYDKKYILETLNCENRKTNHFILPLVFGEENMNDVKRDKNQNLSLVWWGSFNKIHGLDYILTELAEFHKSGGTFSFDIFGVKISKGEKYVRLAQNLGIIDKCHFYFDKFMSDGTLQEMLEFGNYHLSFGLFGDTLKSKSVVANKVVESLYYKFNIVNVRSDAFLEFDGLNSLIYQVNIEKDALRIFLIEHLDLLLNDFDLNADRLKNNDRVFEKHFSRFAFNKKLENIYENM